MSMTLEEQLEELRETLGRLHEQQTPYLMTPLEEWDLVALLDDISQIMRQDMEESQASR